MAVRYFVIPKHHEAGAVPGLVERYRFLDNIYIVHPVEEAEPDLELFVGYEQIMHMLLMDVGRTKSVIADEDAELVMLVDSVESYGALKRLQETELFNTVVPLGLVNGHLVEFYPN